MALESAALARRLTTVAARRGAEVPVAKVVVRQSLIDTADKLTVTAVDVAPTAADILAKAQAAATPFKAGVASQVSAIAAGQNVAETLRKLYLDNAEKAVATLDPGLDEALGKAQLSDLTKKATLLSDDHPLTSYIQGIVDRTAGPNARYPYKVHVLDTPEANAFNAGGSTMVVMTGLFKTVNNEAELAGILDHEITHGENRHVMKKVVAQTLAGTATETFAAANPVIVGSGFFGKAGAIIANLKREASLLNFTSENFEATRNLQRGLEAEADAGGARKMSAAGYDPHALSSWFQRMEVTEQQNAKGLSGLVSGFMNDHPTSVERVAAVESQIKQEGLDASAKDTGAARYLLQTLAYRQPAASTVAAVAAKVATA
jgi:predicted Zn-dependent protease